MQDIICRKYQKSDRSAVRDIAWETAFLGRPADAFFSGREILEDFLTRYFTDYEPRSCFVAEADSRVVGYLIGAKDKFFLEQVFHRRIALFLLARFILQGSFLKKKNLKFVFYIFRSLFQGEFRMADLSRDYPATLHINIRAGFRNLGIGSKLISAYLDYLKQEGISGVSLATMSEQGKKFFLGQGFRLLQQCRRSYFRYILGRDITVYIYGKKL
jgi:GNAT superfamily N-acetyltransferase